MYAQSYLTVLLICLNVILQVSFYMKNVMYVLMVCQIQKFSP